MTADRSPFEEAAAFFDLFVRSDWASCHVRGGAIELFVARGAGHPNPMRAAAADESAPIVALSAEPNALTAPHVGTLVELAAIGTRIAAGERYGRIALLDEATDLTADRAGTIVRHAAEPGELVEFAQALALIG